jgi:uncharacterized membrane protein YfcA
MVPPGVIFISAGVALSDQLSGPVLRKAFGIFLLYVVTVSSLRLYRSYMRRERPLRVERTDLPHVGFVGSVTGFVAGVLGIGGGPIAVPLLRRVCQLRFRECVAASSVTICFTSLVGAAQKNATIAGLTGAAPSRADVTLADSLLLAGCLVPTAILGAFVGAGLTHTLPVNGVRVAFIAVMSGASVLMLL